MSPWIFQLPVRRYLTLFVVALISARTTSLCGTEIVVVKLNDGRVLEGNVDMRTTDDWLWLRFTEPGIALIAPTRWQEVASVTRGEQAISVDEFREIYDELESELPTDFFESDDSPYADSMEYDDVDPLARRGPYSAFDQRVTTLHAHAELANWDRDVEVDGLEVHVVPLNRDREIVPVNGTIMMRLMGERRQRHDRGRPFQDLQYWSVHTSTDDFGPLGATYRFPFNTVQPEFELDLLTHGLLHVQLNSQRDGSFEDSVPVRLREYSYFRDRLQQEYGHRFFPNERTRNTRQHFSRIRD